MGTDETIEKIYSRQDSHRDQILGAIGDVNKNVQANAVQIASTKATVEGYETRIKANEKRMDKIEGRLWKAASAGGATGTLAAVLLKVLFG